MVTIKCRKKHRKLPWRPSGLTQEQTIRGTKIIIYVGKDIRSNWFMGGLFVREQVWHKVFQERKEIPHQSDSGNNRWVGVGAFLDINRKGNIIFIRAEP